MRNWCRDLGHRSEFAVRGFCLFGLFVSTPYYVDPKRPRLVAYQDRHASLTGGLLNFRREDLGSTVAARESILKHSPHDEVKKQEQTTISFFFFFLIIKVGGKEFKARAKPGVHCIMAQTGNSPV